MACPKRSIDRCHSLDDTPTTQRAAPCLGVTLLWIRPRCGVSWFRLAQTPLIPGSCGTRWIRQLWLCFTRACGLCMMSGASFVEDRRCLIPSSHDRSTCVCTDEFGDSMAARTGWLGKEVVLRWFVIAEPGSHKRERRLSSYRQRMFLSHYQK
jgi:hypothetical protein